MKVKMHRKPMKRHTAHVQAADCEASIRVADDGNLPNPGLHLRFRLEDGSTQLIVFGPDALADLGRAVRLASSGCQQQGSFDLWGEAERQGGNIVAVAGQAGS